VKWREKWIILCEQIVYIRLYFIQIHLKFYKVIAVPTLSYGIEVWAKKKNNVPKI